MSSNDNFDVIPLYKISSDAKNANKLFKVKSRAAKWQNFPACVLPKDLVESVIKLKDFKVYDEDVYLFGFPRSGTTLLQEMIWLIVNDFNFEKSRSIITDIRFPMLESFEFVQKFYDGEVKLTFDDLPHPRTIKSHIPVQLLPDEIWAKKPKIIHMSREVKDVAVSMFHYAEDMMQLKNELNDFLQNFIDDKIAFTPYREHCKHFFNIPDYDKIMYLTYEYVTANIEEAIKRVVEFLGKSISDEQMTLMKNHLKFDSMKKNDACNNKGFMKRMNEITKNDRKPEGFIRKGKIGNFKEEMSVEFIEKFDQWMAEDLRQ